MKIGILAFRQDPIVSANTAIAYTIGEEIAKTHEVIYIGRKECVEQNIIKTHNGIKIEFLNKRPKSSLSSTKIQIALRRIRMLRLSVLQDSFALRRIVKRNSIEALICVCAPNENILITRYADLSIPVYLYQLDPYYNQTDDENKKRKKEFRRLLSRFAYLFTTDILYNKYIKDSLFSEYHNIIEAVKFPKLIKKNYTRREKQDFVKLLYAGTLYSRIRPPKILLDLKNVLPAHCVIIFCGTCDNPEDEHILKDNGIICKGQLQQEEIEKEYEATDILINIGNSIPNQLGSKIVDYIATGKPILNVTQQENCPTISVLEKYQYCLNIRADEIPEAKDGIASFVDNAKGKRMDWEDIVLNYKEYTPEYVASQMMQIINPI